MPDRPFSKLAVWNRVGAKDGAEHMALDEAMLCLTAGPTLRVYHWDRPEVTFGYPTRWSDARIFAGDRPATRRCTGGGFVEHGADTTIALAVPAFDAFSRVPPRDAYWVIHEAIRAALGDSSIALSPVSNNAPACFAAAAEHDLVRGTRKIGGGALRRSRDGLLYQGSLLGVTPPSDFPGLLAACLAERFFVWSEPPELPNVASKLVRDRYGCDAWNRRR